MKRILCVLLAILALLAGFFLWKGGHHAVSLASELSRWDEEEASDQYIHLTFDGLSLEGESFWVDRSGRRVYGLNIGDQSLYLRENVLYTDTGKAYALPSAEEDAEKLLWSIALSGRITREGDLRRLTLEQDQLTLNASISDAGGISLDAQFLWDGQSHDLSLSIQRQDTKSHTIPQTVVDAMVRAYMEPPVSILEPLEAVGPALAALSQVAADVELHVECGILNLSEQLQLTAGADGLLLQRDGIEIQLPLPQTMTDVQPAQLGLLFLRHGDYERTGGGARLALQIPGDSIGDMMDAMVPQIAGMGVSYQDAALELFISGEKLERVCMSVSGSVPFLITEIPISITMDCHIQ